MMPESTFINGISDRDLAARLIRMGAIAPMNLDLVNHDKTQEIVAGLPTMYECRYTVKDAQAGELEIACFDLTPEGLNRQVLDELTKRRLQSLPERHTAAEYTPEAWKGYLQRDFDSVDKKMLLKLFQRWGMPLEAEQVRNAFCSNAILNEEGAQEMLRRNQGDLLSRLVRMGVVEPLDLDHVSIQQADKIIRLLPALTESEIIWQGDDDFERKRFVNLAEFRVSKRGFPEVDSLGFDESVTDDELRKSRFGESSFNKASEDSALRGPNVRAGAHTLHLQEDKFLMANEDLEERIIHRREEITGGYAWLDYFRQDKSEALPGGSTSALRNAFKTWGISLKRGKLELGFEADTALNRSEAMLSFYKVLFSKLVNAGIVMQMPKNDWLRLDLAKAEDFAAKIPLLPEHDHPGEWLDFFKQPPPATALEMVQLENRFSEAGIDFDEELISSSFSKSKETKNKIKGIRKMQEITLNDYKKMIGRLTSSGRMERLTGDEFKNLDLENARDYVRGFDDTATEKQKTLLLSMGDEERIEITEDDLVSLSKLEANFIIDNAPQQAMTFEEPENPITDTTRRELKNLMDNGDVPRMPWPRWKNLSEEEGRDKIDRAYARRPASDRQKDFIQQALEENSFPQEAIGQIFNSPTVTEADIDKLNQLQASRLIGSLPASERQIDAVKKLVEEKRIEPLEDYNLSASVASAILDKAYKDGPAERDPDSPATEKQKEALLHLAERKELPAELTPEVIENISFTDAGKALEAAPASRAQKDMVVRLVHEEKLERIPKPELDQMTRGTASLLIDIANGKRPKTDMPEFKELDYPASDSQMKVLNDLREQGKIQEIPENVTRTAASQMINDALAGEPIAPQQLAIIEKKIANNLLPALTSKEKAKLTQGDFSRLLKESRAKEAPKKEQAAPAKERGKSQTRKNTGMSR